MQTGIVFDIKKYSLHDGPGIRTTVFLKGCPLRCWWCHNPESQRPEPDIVPKSARSRDFRTSISASHETIGKRVSVQDVIDEIEKDVIFYDESGGGVTFSGGEPLLQIDFLQALIAACRIRDIHTAVDTSGCAPQQDLARIVAGTDLFLYDLKLMDAGEHCKYTGAPLQVVLANLRYLAEKKAKVIYRVPIIPGITDRQENLLSIMACIKRLNNGNKVSLLAYNHFGDKKYKRLGMANKMPRVASPSTQTMARIKERFETNGFLVTIGG